MGSRANIYIDQGTDFRISIELFDADDDALLIGNYSFKAYMKKFYSQTPVAEFVVEKGTNDITLVLDPITTASLKPGKYEYDVIMRKPTNELSKIVEGLAIVIPTITDSTSLIEEV